MLATEACDIPGGTRFRRHGHDAVHLVAVVAGGFVERAGGGLEDVGPGTVRLSPPAHHHIDFAPRGARCLVIELDAGVIVPPSRSVFLRDDGTLTPLVARLAALTRRRDPGRELAADAAAAELVAQVRRCQEGRRGGPPPPWLARARDLLHDLDPPPALGPLAGMVGVHRVTLARAFRDHFGCPVGAYARRVRLERARRLLARSDLPLAAVAAEAGFSDQAHLTRACRAAFGRTPGDLRRRRTLR